MLSCGGGGGLTLGLRGSGSRVGSTPWVTAEGQVLKVDLVSGPIPQEHVQVSILVDGKPDDPALPVAEKGLQEGVSS